jgi:hypothetical protein
MVQRTSLLQEMKDAFEAPVALMERALEQFIPKDLRDVIAKYPDSFAKAEQLYINLNGQTVITGQPMPDWAEGFKTMFPWDNVGLVFFRMNTMDMLPMHMDSYTTYRKIFDIKDPSVIWRCVVFLEDWKSGHYLEIDDRLLPGWKAGDFILWNNDVPHFAGNFGTEPRYTMQITGMARS